MKCFCHLKIFFCACSAFASSSPDKTVVVVSKRSTSGILSNDHHLEYIMFAYLITFWLYHSVSTVVCFLLLSILPDFFFSSHVITIAMKIFSSNKLGTLNNYLLSYSEFQKKIEKTLVAVFFFFLYL